MFDSEHGILPMPLLSDTPGGSGDITLDVNGDQTRCTVRKQGDSSSTAFSHKAAVWATPSDRYIGQVIEFRITAWGAQGTQAEGVYIAHMDRDPQKSVTGGGHAVLAIRQRTGGGNYDVAMGYIATTGWGDLSFFGSATWTSIATSLPSGWVKLCYWIDDTNDPKRAKLWQWGGSSWTELVGWSDGVSGDVSTPRTPFFIHQGSTTTKTNGTVELRYNFGIEADADPGTTDSDMVAMGDWTVATYVVDGEVAGGSWTPVNECGSNGDWTTIDDVNDDSDLSNDYMKHDSTTSGSPVDHWFTVQALAGTSPTVEGVMLHYALDVNQFSPYQHTYKDCSILARLNGETGSAFVEATDYEDSSHGGTDGTNLTIFFPDTTGLETTGGAWTETDFNNLEVGLRHNASSSFTDCRVYYIVISVLGKNVERGAMNNEVCGSRRIFIT